MNLSALNDIRDDERRLDEQRRRLLIEGRDKNAVAVPCPCGHPGCTNWHVSPHADVQGVHFTQQEAEAVADFLNRMDA